MGIYKWRRNKISTEKNVATVGTIEFEPNTINVIPSKSTFTVDLRNPNEEKLKADEEALKMKKH